MQAPQFSLHERSPHRPLAVCAAQPLWLLPPRIPPVAQAAHAEDPPGDRAAQPPLTLVECPPQPPSPLVEYAAQRPSPLVE